MAMKMKSLKIFFSPSCSSRALFKEAEFIISYANAASKMTLYTIETCSPEERLEILREVAKAVEGNDISFEDVKAAFLLAYGEKYVL